MENCYTQRKNSCIHNISNIEKNLSSSFNNIPYLVIKKVEKIKIISLENSFPKIKHKSICKDWENGGLKNVEISHSLHCYGIRRLCDNFMHKWTSKISKKFKKSIKKCSKNVHFLSQLFGGGNLKSGDDLKLQYNLTNEIYFQQLQLKHAVFNKWKTNIKLNSDNISNLAMQYTHRSNGATILMLDRLSSKE